jgi:proteasome accessory factor C
MLALLRHLRPDTETPLEELADAVGSTPEQIAEDVATLSMCGVAPYDPLDLVSAFVDQGNVIVMGPHPALDRPVRLSPGEAQALATALKSTGLGEELSATLMEAASQEFSPDELEHRILTADPPPAGDIYEVVASAAASHEVLTVRYQRFGDRAVAEREIEPLSLFNDRGVWYVDAFCRSAGAPRTFRLDRMRAARPSGECFEASEALPSARAFDGNGLPRARLVFGNATEYSERDWPGSVPVGEVATDGSLAVEVPYSGTGWIARQVCARLGAVIVESPQEVRAAVASAAERIATEMSVI